VAVVVVAAALIGLATLRPDRSHEGAHLILCVLCGEHGFADAIVNAVLFAPLGIGFSLLSLHARRAVLLGALASGIVEALQFVIPGRDPSVGDVLFDTVGTWIGFAIVAVLPFLSGFDRRRASRVSVLGALLVALCIGITGWLLQPSFPHSTYWGRWTPNLEAGRWYRGRVRDARIAGREVRPRQIDDSEWIRDALLRGGPIEVTATAGPRLEALGSLFGVEDEHGREIMLLGPDGDDLVYRFRTNAISLRLDQPDIRLVDGWRDVAPGTTIHVRAWSAARGTWCLTVLARSACDLGFTVGSGWSVLYYPETTGNQLRVVLSVVWVAAIVFPAGFWIRRRWEAGLTLAIVASALLWLPEMVLLRPTPVSQWCGALLGLGTGVLASWGIGRAARFRG